ncbi:MAG: LamG-like jellyroll fold domain-containing protein, partial [Candidatus Nanohaloarchaea archaeon]|nr:LamG-like jellyroll fold domain-containing protein [Candidatus Nanohaloarchaea archaeon]
MGSTTRTLVLVLLVAFFAATGAAWWDSGWQYRKPINVTEQSGRTLQDYAVSINPGLFPTNGLVGSWHFSAGDGDHARDFSGHANHGRLNGGAWTTGTRSAVRLQGGDHVALGTEPELGPSTLTLLVWVKPTGSKEKEYLYDGRNHEFWLKEQDRTEKLQPGITISGNSHFFTMDTPLQQGTWYLAAMTYDGETLSAYLFNSKGRLLEEQHDGSMSGGIDQSSGTSRIGNYIGGGYGYAGAIDDVKLYNRALKEGTIRSMAESPSGPGLDDLRFATPDGTQLDYFHRYD